MSAKGPAGQLGVHSGLSWEVMVSLHGWNGKAACGGTVGSCALRLPGREASFSTGASGTTCWFAVHAGTCGSSPGFPVSHATLRGKPGAAVRVRMPGCRPFLSLQGQWGCPQLVSSGPLLRL